MMRISPFSETSDAMPDEDRVNMWPLVYHNNATTSVLWPFIDFDRDGFSVRPLLAKDKEEWSMLWPLSGWDADSGDGWFLNSYWESDSHFGILPLTHVGRDWGWFGTAYWGTDTFGIFPLGHKDDKGGYLTLAYWASDAWGVFPVTYFAKDGSRGYVGPAYWGENAWGVFPVCHIGDESGWLVPAYWGKRNLGLFPLFNVGEGLSYYGPFWNTELSHGMFPLYRRTKYGDVDEHSLLFRLGFWREGPDEHRSWMIPFYYHHRGADSGLTMSLLGGSYRSGDCDGLWMLPGYWSESGPNHKRRMLFPFYYGRESATESHHLTPVTAWHRSAESSSRWIFPTWLSRNSEDLKRKQFFPFWFHEETGERETSWLLPVYYHQRDEVGSRTITPIGSWYEYGDESGMNIYPFWWSHHSSDGDMRAFLPFFYSKSQGEHHAWITPFGGYGWEDSSTDHFANILGPLYHHHESGDGSFSLTGCMWPLYTGWRSGQTSNHFVPLVYRSTHSPSETRIGFCAELGQYHSDGASTSWMFWPLVSQSDRKDLPGWAWDTTLFHFHEHDGKSISRYTPFMQFSRDDGSSQSRVFPFYGYRSDAENKNLNFLLWTGNYHRSDEGSSWRLWPFAASSCEAQRPDFLYYLSFFSTHRFGDRSSWVFTPLVGSSRKGDIRKSWVFPLAWWNHDIARKDYSVSWLLGTGNLNISDEGMSVRQFPLFSHANAGKKPGLGHYLNLFSRYDGGAKQQYGITPFINYASNPTGHDAWVFPLVSSHKREDRRDFYSLAGLFHYGRDTNEHAFRLTPFFSYASDDRVTDELYGLNLIRFLNEPGRSKFSLLGSILLSYRKDQTERATNRVLRYLLFGKSWHDVYSDDDIPAPRDAYRQTLIKSTGNTFYPAYRNEYSQFRVWGDTELTDEDMVSLKSWWEDGRRGEYGHRRVSDGEVHEIMERVGVDVRDQNRGELRAAVLKYALAHSELRTTKETRSMVYRYDRSHKDISWKVLFGLLSYKYTEGDDRSRFSILRYLYRRDRNEDQICRSFFPFIKWDSSERKSCFSFCWRLWNYRRDGDRVGGHFFFIPWGDQGE